MTEKAVRVRIEGKVQGVWFRGWTVAAAEAKGLRGWVRNRRDGSVEALFIGPQPAVDSMIAECWQGPPTAQVTAVSVQPAPAEAVAGFTQRPTL